MILVPLLLGYSVRQRRVTRVQMADQQRRHRDVRHAPGSDVRIEVGYRPRIVRLSVVNGPPPGPAEPAPPGGGHGLIGMRERTGMLGGDLSAGPTPEGGFAVRAALPLKGDS